MDANAARRPWHGRLARPEAWGHLAGGWKSAITRAWAHGHRCTVESTTVEWERRERQQRDVAARARRRAKIFLSSPI
jgi:7-cyano-7-deazaguanine synthase in queuosine biosynthesis